jgi:mannose-1-phosphate guanylyltransferase/mannose-6-phosphate isomerase
MRIQPVILCGGVGSRLWPLSTVSKPKQFLPLLSDEAMLALTARRVSDPEIFERPIVVGGQRYLDLMRRALPRARLIIEPFGRNSAAAIAAAASLVDQKTVQLVLPADHRIADTGAFSRAVQLGYGEAQRGRIVTFGIEPTHPATAYGYIKAANADHKVRHFPVEQFIEKPDLATAQALLAVGGHFWNAGIFMFRSDIMLAAFDQHASDILSAIKGAIAASTKSDDEVILDPTFFGQCRSESIDYAVMETTGNMTVVPVSMGWSDIGDHAALALAVEDQGKTSSQGPVVKEACANCFVRSDGPTVGLYGVSNLAVIASRDAVLVTHLDNAASIKPLVERVEEDAVKAQVGQATRERISQWLYGALLPRWLELAQDEVGGFVEALDEAGTPLVELPRRGRVAPRQVFTFAEAVLQGWDPDGAASKMVEQGIDYIHRRARSPRGGWASLIGSDGQILDDRRSLYDHAFVAMAGAHAHRATGSNLALQIAEEAFAFIDSVCQADDKSGWFDPDSEKAARLANPHMHLLEASLVMFDATADPAALDRAVTIALHFEAHMFAAESGAMFEHFDEDWSVQPDRARSLVEPGHCYEWASLLKKLDRLSGRDTRSWCNRLVAFGDNVTATRHGRVPNAVVQSGEAIDSNSRLWPQLERIRAKLNIAEASAPGAVDTLVADVFDAYLNHEKPWLWRDELDNDGRSLRTRVPASMLYHFATAMAPIASADKTAAMQKL